MNKFKRKILKYTMLLLAVVLIAFLSFVFYYDKQELEREFSQKVEWLTNAVIMSSREPLWNLDQTVLKENMESFLSVDSVMRLTIQDKLDYFTIDVGETTPENVLLRVHESIFYEDKHIGYLTIYFTKRILEGHVWENFFKLVGEIILLFILILVLVIVISRKYAEPMTNLAKTIKKFDVRDPGSYMSIWENTDVEEIQHVISSYKEMAEEISANFQELEATNETLKDMNDKLEKKSDENRQLADKLSKIIEISSKFDEATQMTNEYFMQMLFKNAFQIIPEADYGSAFLYRENKVLFIDSVGHDINLLRQTKIPQDIFTIDTDIVDVKKNVMNFTTENKPKRSGVVKRDLEIVEQATKPFKETLFFELSVGNAVEGGISLDIASESDQSFSYESLESMKAFRYLATAFYKIKKYGEMKEAFTKELIISIIKMLEIHDNYTKGHSENVANLTFALSQALNLSHADCKRAYWAGLVHDLGKILIPDAILNKTTQLTSAEFERIKQHPVWGYETLKNSDQLKNIAELVLHHHERWDGRGYPSQLRGQDIPKISRIITIVDAWDAMSSKRSYRKPLDFESALSEIEKNAGKQFDPVFAHAFIKLIKENRKNVSPSGKFLISSSPVDD